ncbi:MAG: molybdopterin converting factor subunit 1 [Rhodocyclales bacterium]|nr:molybdopterin converting factor subunit 1 [Rhodocyclales bacterium]
MIKILYFASLREKLGSSGESLELPAGVTDIGGLLAWLAQRGGEWASLAAVKNLKSAVNQEMARATTPVQDGDEVAFFPPVTGG